MAYGELTASRPLAKATPWSESIVLRRRWHAEALAAGEPSIEDRRADQVSAWRLDLEGEIERYADDPEADPREALVQLIAIAGAAIDAMGQV